MNKLPKKEPFIENREIHTPELVFKPTRGTNEVMSVTDTCYVSYNLHPCEGMPFLISDNSGSETALCIDGTCLILNGDYRCEYQEAAKKGVEGCLDVYTRNKAYRSSWSED